MKSYRKQCARCGTTITAFDAHTRCDPCAKEINKTMEKLENPTSLSSANVLPSDSDAALAAQLGIVYPPQLAQTLGVSESTLQLWRQNGNGPPFVKMGKYVLYRVRDVHEWLDKNITDRVRERTTTEVPPVHYKQQSVYSKINPNVYRDAEGVTHPFKQIEASREGSTDGTD
jgi:predicted DNA-binding transcriptional regulator AlpA